MRIGIITFHRAINFGAILQVYALFKFIRQLNHDVYIIDFYPSISLTTVFLSVHEIKNIINMFLRNPASSIYHMYLVVKRYIQRDAVRKRYAQKIKKSYFENYFSAFCEKHLQMTKKKYRSIKDLRNYPPDMDVYITGSDQVWASNNPSLLAPFYLDFGKNEIRRISYAASFGSDRLKVFRNDYFQRNISRFHSVSVRERSGVKIVKDLCGINAEVVLDPTFLIEDYSDITETIKDKDKFIFVYRLHQTEKLKRLLSDLIILISKELNIKVKTISITDNFSDIGEDIVTGVEGFLELIVHSEIVITNSLHGTVFSILFKKPFICFPRDDMKKKGQNARMIDLLSDLGLMSRYFDLKINNNLQNIFNEKINWTLVFERLSSMRKKSIDYLVKSLSIQ